MVVYGRQSRHRFIIGERKHSKGNRMLPSDRDTHDGSPPGPAGSRKFFFMMFLSRQTRAVVPRRSCAIFSQWGHALTCEEFLWLVRAHADIFCMMFLSRWTRAMVPRCPRAVFSRWDTRRRAKNFGGSCCFFFTMGTRVMEGKAASP
jgi:hypothetical protein